MDSQTRAETTYRVRGCVGHNNPWRGVVSEWSKERAWKARTRDKRVVGSNPTHSASVYFSFVVLEWHI